MYIVFVKLVECLFYVYRCKFVIVSPLDEHYMLLGQTILLNKYLLNQPKPATTADFAHKANCKLFLVTCKKINIQACNRSYTDTAR
jgi:hypothetical protein